MSDTVVAKHCLPYLYVNVKLKIHSGLIKLDQNIDFNL